MYLEPGSVTRASREATGSLRPAARWSASSTSSACRARVGTRRVEPVDEAALVLDEQGDLPGPQGLPARLRRVDAGDERR